MIATPPSKAAGRKLTVAEYHAMIEAAIVGENDRVELIRGELVPTMPIDDADAACVNRLNRLFNRLDDDGVIVQVQNPVALADSEPEPDLSLVRFRPDFYASGKPTPADVLLIVEVADSSLDFDRHVKGTLYAENGVAEYWIVDLTSDTVFVHRNPRSDGAWTDITTYARSAVLTLLAAPSMSVAVVDLFP